MGDCHERQQRKPTNELAVVFRGAPMLACGADTSHARCLRPSGRQTPFFWAAKTASWSRAECLSRSPTDIQSVKSPMIAANGPTKETSPPSSPTHLAWIEDATWQHSLGIRNYMEIMGFNLQTLA